MRTLYHRAALLIATTVTVAGSGSVSYGAVLTIPTVTFSSVAAPSVYIPQLDPTLGTLTSISFKFADLELSQEVLVDYDDSTTYEASSFSLNRTVTFGLNANAGLSGPPPSSQPIYVGGGVTTSASVEVPILQVDDGDGPGAHDGGIDESIHALSFPVISGLFSFNDAEWLDLFTGTGTVIVRPSPFVNLDWAIGYPTFDPLPGEWVMVTPFQPQIEIYDRSQTYSGLH